MKDMLQFMTSNESNTVNYQEKKLYDEISSKIEKNINKYIKRMLKDAEFYYKNKRTSYSLFNSLYEVEITKLSIGGSIRLYFYKGIDNIIDLLKYDVSPSTWIDLLQKYGDKEKTKNLPTSKHSDFFSRYYADYFIKAFRNAGYNVSKFHGYDGTKWNYSFHGTSTYSIINLELDNKHIPKYERYEK